MTRNIVVAITGASGVTYSVRLLEVLLAAGCDVHLLISAVGQTVLEQELDLRVDPENFSPAMLMLDSGATPRDPKLQLLRTKAGISSDSSDVLGMGSGRPGTLRFYRHQDYLAPLASGSFATDGMVVCPCSCGTLSAIATGAVNNLIHRAAAVHLKERRKLILVPRETPLALNQIENMRQATLSGAVILPAAPAFYHGVKLIGDLVDFVVARICDQLGIANGLIEPWT
jgi:4-hydroxy-3-polyprenylbenzoate decarboxylase